MNTHVVFAATLLTTGCCLANDFCFADAAKRYNVDPALLIAIAQQESSLNPLAVNVNSDASRDVGVMQINSKHLPKLAQFNITEKDLWDPCTNINVGAWVLAGSIARFGATWRAVGAYNAGNRADREVSRRVYAQSIANRFIKLRPSTEALAVTAVQPVMKVFE